MWVALVYEHCLATCVVSGDSIVINHTALIGMILL